MAPSLDEVLREVRPGWTKGHRAVALSKLSKLDITTSEQLARALEEHGKLNARLRDAGLRAFTSETLIALRSHLDVGLPVNSDGPVLQPVGDIVTVATVGDVATESAAAILLESAPSAVSSESKATSHEYSKADHATNVSGEGECAIRNTSSSVPNGFVGTEMQFNSQLGSFTNHDENKTEGQGAGLPSQDVFDDCEIVSERQFLMPPLSLEVLQPSSLAGPGQAAGDGVEVDAATRSHDGSQGEEVKVVHQDAGEKSDRQLGSFMDHDEKKTELSKLLADSQQEAHDELCKPAEALCAPICQLACPESASDLLDSVEEYERWGFVPRVHPSVLLLAFVAVASALSVCAAVVTKLLTLVSGLWPRLPWEPKAFDKEGSSYGKVVEDQGGAISSGRMVCQEPSEDVLDEWEMSAIANSVIMRFALDDEIQADRLSLQQVLHLLEALGLRREEFVSMFGNGLMNVCVDSAAISILEKRRLPQNAPDPSALSCRQVYRLLEVVGFTLERFKSTLGDVHSIDTKSANSERVTTFGSYRVFHELGRGMSGSSVRLAEHEATSARVALKFPVGSEEVSAMREFQAELREGHSCLGLPKLLAAGMINGNRYLAAELMGPDLLAVFQCLEGTPVARRWLVIRVIGRMLLRSLEAVHRHGFVHGDVAPHNVLLGAKVDGAPLNDVRASGRIPILIDFGCARRYPGSGPVPRARGGSLEYSSIRSAEGLERRPEDDLEALGWTMVSGVFGELPWFRWLLEFYELKESVCPGCVGAPGLEGECAAVIERVRRAKECLLCEGWNSLGSEWDKFQNMPEELDGFMRACRAVAEPPARPDYALLAKLLGCSMDFISEGSERDDLRDYEKRMAPMFRTGLLISPWFAAGDAVNVWSLKRQGWVEDGIVEEVALTDRVVNCNFVTSFAQLALTMDLPTDQGLQWVVPHGSVRVTYGNGTGEKWIMPSEQQQLLRRAPKTPYFLQ